MESAKEISKKSKSSFYYAFNLLPPPKRDAMNTVYAFCRETDDIVDEGLDNKDSKYQRLLSWRRELEQAMLNRSQYPLLNTLAGTIQQFNIPIHHFFDLIRGMEMDLSQNRYETFEELRLYCYRVASTVGMMCIEIFGYKHESAKAFAENLGIALQLTNIIRDVNKDAQKDRIYIPREDLHLFDYSESDLFNRVYNVKFIQLMEYQAERAKHYFNLATENLALDDKGSMFAARAMQHIYFRTLERIIQAKYDVFNNNIKISKFEKVGISLGVWAKYSLVY
ncbi:MAG: presqualene diphosphate synthase HpnD [Ignavibacteriaceae bacterium]|nr:presqualene diphosphate synthase HpnD [Ignavibacteriaceae bacterium]